MSLFFLDCTILYFSGCHFFDHYTIFSKVFLVKLKIWRFCLRIKYSIFSCPVWKGLDHQIKSNLKVRSFSGWKYSMTAWMKYSTVHCKLENRNQEETFYREILKNSNLPKSFFVYEYKGMKYSNFMCNKHGRLNKL